MKSQKLAKKLVINKQTVANLENQEMADVKGGTLTTFGEFCYTGHTYTIACFYDVDTCC